MKERDWKTCVWMRNNSKMCLMEVRGLDTCGLGQGQMAGTSKHGNETSDLILCGGGLRAEGLLSL